VPVSDGDVFARIICGVDRSPEGLEAVRQAALLAPAEARLLLVRVLEPNLPVEYVRLAPTELEQARTVVAEPRSAEVLLVRGHPVSVLRGEAERERATLLAVGIHRARRSEGVIERSVATALLHDAPCSVLVARVPLEPAAFPRSIVVGLDGSPQAAAALRVAAGLAARVGCPVAALTALGGEVDREGVGRALADTRGVEHVEEDRPPVEALVGAEADLLVVGSRGLRGLHALGSVSERVANRALCSTLVVR
jgi:nucleotide-binding universal stress UspA family protein